MGNCLNPNNKIVPEDSFKLLDHDYDIKHKIDTNSEAICKIDSKLNNLNQNYNQNFELISQDIEKLKLANNYLTQLVNNMNSNYLSSHQESSRYGGLAPDTEHSCVEGPLVTIDSTSSKDNALL
jgi:hypothetical protein